MPSGPLSLQTLWAAPLVLALLSIAGQAADGDQAPAVACHRSGDVTVVSRPRAEDPGQDIYVRTSPPGAADSSCTYAPKPEDWIVGQGEPDAVLALQGRFLVLDSGTGSDRTLKILDTAARTKLVETAYDDDTGKFAADAGAITYWRVGDKPVKPAACPAAWKKDKDHKTAKRAHRTYQVRFGVAKAKARDTGKTNCRLTQDDM